MTVADSTPREPTPRDAAVRGARIAIVGGGLIGASWAAVFAHHGAVVRLWDPAPDAAASARDRFDRARVQLSELGSSDSRGSFAIVEELADALEGAALVQENAPESIPVKHELYGQIEALVSPEVIIASSTSALTWSELSPGLTRPERFVTAHPFNPPHLVPLVEVYGVDDPVAEQASAIYGSAGRVPVRLRRDATGHIANRLSSALYREAVNIVAEGIADVAAVDAALVHGPGLRWSVIGAHMTYHLGGGAGGLAAYLDHLGPSQERRWADLGSPTLDDATKARLVDGIDDEAGGRSVAELEAERDARLIAALRARQP